MIANSKYTLNSTKKKHEVILRVLETRVSVRNAAGRRRSDTARQQPRLAAGGHVGKGERMKEGARVGNVLA
jgi:hypothetical protein